MARQNTIDFLKKELECTAIPDIDSLLGLLNEVEGTQVLRDGSTYSSLIRECAQGYDRGELASKYGLTVPKMTNVVHCVVRDLNRYAQAETDREKEFMRRLPYRIYQALLRGYYGDKTFESIQAECKASEETGECPAWRTCRHIGRQNAAVICNCCSAYLKDHNMVCPRCCIEGTPSIEATTSNLGEAGGRGVYIVTDTTTDMRYLLLRVCNALAGLSDGSAIPIYVAYRQNGYSLARLHRDHDYEVMRMKELLADGPHAQYNPQVYCVSVDAPPKEAASSIATTIELTSSVGQRCVVINLGDGYDDAQPEFAQELFERLQKSGNTCMVYDSMPDKDASWKVISKHKLPADQDCRYDFYTLISVNAELPSFEKQILERV